MFFFLPLLSQSLNSNISILYNDDVIVLSTAITRDLHHLGFFSCLYVFASYIDYLISVKKCYCMNLSSEHFSACYGKREKKVGGGDEREVEGTNQTLIKKTLQYY